MENLLFGLQLVFIICEDIRLCVSRMYQYEIKDSVTKHPHLCHPMLVQLLNKGVVYPHILQGRNPVLWLLQKSKAWGNFQR